MPSSQPTSTPTRIRLPVVRVREILHTASRFSVSLQVVFTDYAFYAGTMYCTAVRASILSLSSNQSYSLVFAGSKASYLSGSTDVRVTIEGLAAVQKYSILCGAQSVFGVTSSASDIVNSVVNVTTTCCRSVSLTSAPSYLYADGAQNIGKNVFTFSLSSLPDQDLFVTPTLWLRSNISAAVSSVDVALAFFTPSVVRIYSNSSRSSLLSSVLLSTDYHLSPSSWYLVRFVLSGSDADKYNVTSTAALTILYSDAPPPVPQLLFVRLSDNGNALYMVFDSSTNSAGISSSRWPCSRLWQFTSAANSTCNWLNKTTIFAGLSSHSTIGIGDQIMLKAGLVAAECVSTASACATYSTVPITSLSIDAPLNPISPAVVLSSSSLFTICSNVTMDATASSGSGGRAWAAVNWEVYSSIGTVSLGVSDYLNLRYGDSAAIETRIVAPLTLFIKDKYLVTLTLTNFLGKSSSQTVSFLFGADVNVPMVSIGGPATIATKAAAPITLWGYLELSACANISAIAFSWVVADVTPGSISSVITSISSSSRNQRCFSVPGYQFVAGRQYSVSFVAKAKVVVAGMSNTNSSAAITVIVISGAVHAVVIGSTSRYISQSTVLDASASYDEDSPNAALFFSWVCTYGNGNRFGAPCQENASPSGTNNAVLDVDYDALIPDTVYVFTVTVSDFAQRRTDFTSVKVVKAVTETKAALALSSKSPVLNYGLPETLEATIQCNTDVIVTWEAFIDGRKQSVLNETQMLRYFTADSVITGLSFPLLISKVDFPWGSKVDLRLSIYQVTVSSTASAMSIDSGSDGEVFIPHDVKQLLPHMALSTMQPDVEYVFKIKLITYAQTTMKVNLPPQGGSLAVSPNHGTALVTSFLAMTSGWQDDPTDFPFTYDFRYSIDNAARVLMAQSESTFSSASMVLPAGMESLDYAVIVFVRVYDVYATKAEQQTLIKVFSADDPASVDFGSVLGDLISDVTVTTSASLQTAVLNAVSSTMNFVNCSSASNMFCANLNRYPCSRTAQTCSSCFGNFTGVSGDANSMCVAITGATRPVGASCNFDRDCITGHCSVNSKLCVAPTQTCPINNDGVECSGMDRGLCQYTIGSRTVAATDCKVTDTSCTPQCVCLEGYAGTACQFTSDELEKRSAVRADMCQYLTTTIQQSDPSTSLVESLSASLLSIYDNLEISTEQALETCRSSLLNVLANTKGSTAAKLDGAGLITSNIDMSVPHTSATIVSLLSKFVIRGNASFINNATSVFTESALLGMAAGQSDVKLTSDNYNVRLSRALLRDLSFSTQSVPQSVDEIAYEKPAIRVEVGSGAKACDDGSGYASMAIGAFSTNPYNMSSPDSLVSAVLRIESFDAAVQSQPRIDYDSSASFAYYLSFPFDQQQYFTRASYNFRDENETLYTVHNETLPECSEFVSGIGLDDTTVVRTCSNCVISTFTNTSVVFACYNISNICASGTLQYGRRLIADDDSLPTSRADLRGSVYQAAALSKRVVTVTKAVLTSNPFDINVEDAKGIIAFVSCLVFCTLGGVVFFYRWDLRDKAVLRDEQKKRADIHKNMVRMTSHLNIDRDSFAYNIVGRLKTMIKHSLPISIHDVSRMTFIRRYFVMPFLQHHEYFMPAGKPSLTDTRMVRWISFSVSVYLSLFLDTLFFTIFYVDDGTCETFITETECTAEMNKIYAMSKCLWDADKGCSLRPPPANRVFSVVVSCVTMLIAVPLSMLFDYLLNEVCSKRPEFWDGGLLMRAISVSPLEEVNVMLTTKSLVSDIIDEVEDVEGSVHHQEEGDTEKAPIRHVTNAGIDKDTLQLVYELVTYSVKTLISGDVGDVVSEMRTIITKAKPYFDHPLDQSKRAQLWELTMTPMGISQLRLMWHWLMRKLGYRSVKDKLVTTDLHGSKLLKLRKTLIENRKRSDKIVRVIIGGEEDDDDEESPEHSFIISLHKSVRSNEKGEPEDGAGGGIDFNQDLLQFFILEQLPVFHRYSVRRQCFAHDFVLPEKIWWFYWLCAWLLIVGAICFFVYWTFAWCIFSGNAVFESWSSVLIANFLQDMLFIQVCKVYVIYISTQGSIIPRLLVIQTTLDRLAYDVFFKLQEAVRRVVVDNNRTIGPLSDPLENLFDLPELHDAALVQHFSPACRAARSEQLRYLPAALLLQSMRDIDVHHSRKPPYSHTLSIIAALAFALPVLLEKVTGSALSDLALDGVVDALITTVCAGLLFFLFHFLVAGVLLILLFTLIYVFFSVRRYYAERKQELRFVVRGFASMATKNEEDEQVDGSLRVIRKMSVYVRPLIVVADALTAVINFIRQKRSYPYVQNFIWLNMNEPDKVEHILRVKLFTRRKGQSDPAVGSEVVPSEVSRLMVPDMIECLESRWKQVARRMSTVSTKAKPAVTHTVAANNINSAAVLPFEDDNNSV